MVTSCSSAGPAQCQSKGTIQVPATAALLDECLTAWYRGYVEGWHQCASLPCCCLPCRQRKHLGCHHHHCCARAVFCCTARRPVCSTGDGAPVVRKGLQQTEIAAERIATPTYLRVERLAAYERWGSLKRRAARLLGGAGDRRNRALRGPRKGRVSRLAPGSTSMSTSETPPAEAPPSSIVHRVCSCMAVAQ